MIYLKQIEEEKRKIEQVNSEIAKYEELILHQEKKLDGDRATHNNNVLIKNQVQLLSNRIDKQLVELQDLNYKNASLKENIEHLRLERVKYDVIYRKFEDILHEKKREMSLVIEDSKHAYQYKEQVLAEINKIKEKADQEMKGFEEDFEEFGELIRKYQHRIDATKVPKIVEVADDDVDEFNNNNNDSEYFIRKKTEVLIPQVNNELIQELNFKSKSTKSLLSGLGTISLGNNTNNATIGINASVTSLPNNAHGNSSKSLFNTQLSGAEGYEACIHQIQHNFGLSIGSDPDLIIQRFLELENANFSLFSYINTVNAEIEHFEHCIDEMRKKIDQHRGTGFQETEQRKVRNRAIVDKLYRTKSKCVEYEEIYKNSVQTIDTLKLGIHNILARVGSSANNALNSVDPLVANFNASDTVEVSDILTYIGLIEQRTNEILFSYATSQQAMHNNVNKGASSNVTNSVITDSTLQLPYLAPASSLNTINNKDIGLLNASGLLKDKRNENSSPGTDDARERSAGPSSESNRNSLMNNKTKSTIPEILNRTYKLNITGTTTNDDDSDGDNEGDWDDRPWERQELENFAKKGYASAQKKRQSTFRIRRNLKSLD